MAIKFPRTPHLVYLGEKIRGDLVLSPPEIFNFSGNIIVQEKVDGNCIGIDFDKEANLELSYRNEKISGRNSLLFKQAISWATNKQNELVDILEDKYVLFGEWLYWQHTIKYDRLPSYFLAHDLYDKHKKRFLSTKKMSEVLQGSSIKQNPVIGEGTFSLDQLVNIISKSQFGNGSVEGIYLRVDSDLFNEHRAKIVSPIFHSLFDQRYHWKDKVLRAIKANKTKEIKNKVTDYSEMYL